MPKQIHPRGPEWERGYMAGYYAKRKVGLEYLRECREENKLLRGALAGVRTLLLIERAGGKAFTSPIDVIDCALESAGGGE